MKVTNILTLSIPDEGYSNILTLSIPDEGYSNILTLSIPDEYSNILTLMMKVILIFYSMSFFISAHNTFLE